VRIGLDLVRNRHRERTLIETCLALRQPFVVDGTNATRADRARYLEMAKPASRPRSRRDSTRSGASRSARTGRLS
jgi:hypothetical protein